MATSVAGREWDLFVTNRSHFCFYKGVTPHFLSTENKSLKGFLLISFFYRQAIPKGI
jgi:hypothetical protein